MPEDGRNASARLHGSPAHHLRALKALRDSLFAPRFRALETYSEAPPPPPTLADVITAARAVSEWHRAKEIDAAAELAGRRAAGGNAGLIDAAARGLAHHRAERERIADELAALAPRWSAADVPSND